MKNIILFFGSALIVSGTFHAGEIPESYPSWWLEYSIINFQTENLQNQSSINQGQAKFFTQQAIQYLDDRLSKIGGAGFTLTESLDTSKQAAHYSPLNLGQLKNLTAPFYQRFEEIGFSPLSPGWPTTLHLVDPVEQDLSPNYPWLSDTGTQNLNHAKIGEVKHLFSWNLDLWLAVDSEPDGLPDYWEKWVVDLDPFDALVSIADVLPDDDGDGDELDMEEEFHAGTNPLLNDTDGDGYLDGVEARTEGLDPLVPDDISVIAAQLTRETWNNVLGNQVSDLTSLTTFPDQPDTVLGWSDSVVTIANQGDNFGMRVAGIFRAPRTGEYRFHLNGDETAELWLLTSEGRNKIAFVAAATAVGDWTASPEQVSAPISLEAGQGYILEILWKEGTGADHVQLGITFPTAYKYCAIGRAELPVRSKWFQEPPPTVSLVLDGDEDGLTDYEEWVHGTDPTRADTDLNGASDQWEIDNGFDPLDPTQPVMSADLDLDNLNNGEEAALNTNPHSQDTDCDGLDDDTEIDLGTDPLVPDNPGICLEVFTRFH